MNTLFPMAFILMVDLRERHQYAVQYDTMYENTLTPMFSILTSRIYFNPQGVFCSSSSYITQLLRLRCWTYRFRQSVEVILKDHDLKGLPVHQSSSASLRGLDRSRLERP